MPERHKLAETLNDLRHDFGCNAKSVAEKSKKVQLLRKKIGFEHN